MDNRTSERRARPPAVPAVAVVEPLETRRLLTAATPGTLDATFGRRGNVTLGLSQPSSLFASLGVALPDGKALLVGELGSGLAGAAAFAQVNADGSPDRTFGTDGIAVGPPSLGLYQIDALAVDPQGRIYVGGGGDNENAGGPDDGTLGCVARFNPDGTPDPTFGYRGFLYAVGSSANVLQQVEALAVEPDGSVLAAGYVNRANPTNDFFASENTNDFGIVRLLPDGSINRSFGQDGIVVTVFALDGQHLNADARSLHVFADGSFLVGGGGDGYLELARYHADGTPDAAFGDGGAVHLGGGGPTGSGPGDRNYTGPYTYGGPFFTALAVRDTDGTIFAAGGTPANFGSDGAHQEIGPRGGPLVLAAFQTDGQPVASFGAGGVTYVATGPPAPPNEADNIPGAVVDGLQLLPGAQLLIAGSDENYPGPVTLLARYNADGTPDLTFAPLLPPADGPDPAAGFHRLPDRLGPAGDPELDALLPPSADGSTRLVIDSALDSVFGIETLRLTPGGSIDPTYGRRGLSLLNRPAPDTATPRTLVPIPSRYGGGAYLTVDGSGQGGGLNGPITVIAGYDARGRRRPSLAVPQAPYDVLSVAAVQADGKVIATRGERYELLIYRFNPDGTPDATFGDAGVVTIGHHGSKYDGTIYAPQLLPLPGGSIVVELAAGDLDTEQTLYLLSPKGRQIASRSLPPRRGENDSDWYTRLALTPDGNVLARSISETPVAGLAKVQVSRFHGDDLTRDDRFGRHGTAVVPLTDDGRSPPGGLAVLPDGRIVVSGGTAASYSNNPAGAAGGLVMLDPTGARDGGFGQHGVLDLPPGFGVPGNDLLLADAHGRILSASVRGRFGSTYLLRLRGNGSVDKAFGQRGVAVMPGGTTLLTLTGAGADGKQVLWVAGSEAPPRFADIDPDRLARLTFLSRVILG